MRTHALALTLVVGIAATASAQSSSLTALAQDAQRLAQSSRRVAVSDGTVRTELPAAAAPYATGGPLATVQARALEAGGNPTVPEFRIRSWREGADVRVLVFAVTSSGPTREVREEQVTSVLVPLYQSVEIAATEKYNARRFSVTTYIHQPVRSPGVRLRPPVVDPPMPR